MNFFRRFFGGRRRESEPLEEKSAPGPPGKAESQEDEDAFRIGTKLFGTPEDNAPMVMAPLGSAMMITDRMSYEYQHGLAKGTDPSQAALDDMLGKVDRLLVLSGGMMRDQSLGTDVLLDTRDRVEISAFRDALRVDE